MFGIDETQATPVSPKFANNVVCKNIMVKGYISNIFLVYAPIFYSIFLRNSGELRKVCITLVEVDNIRHDHFILKQIFCRQVNFNCYLGIR